MEENKFDLNSLIGFVLLGAIMIWYFYMNQPTPEQLESQKMEQAADSLRNAQTDVEEPAAVAEPRTFGGFFRRFTRSRESNIQRKLRQHFS